MLVKYIHKELIFVNHTFKSKEELFAFISKKAAKKGLLGDEKLFEEGLNEREKQGSTELKPGMAIPHAKIDTVREMFVSIIIPSKSVKFSPGFGKGVGIIILIGAPKADNSYMKILGAIARLLENDDFINELKTADVIEDVLFSIKKHSISETEIKEDTKPKYLVVLSINTNFSIKPLLASFLELGINQPTRFSGENLSSKSNFGFPTFGMSLIDKKSTISENQTIIGITEDSEVTGKLYKILLEQGIDLNKPGIGALYSIDLKHCFGGVNLDIDF